jgi:hypothetical protein
MALRRKNNLVGKRPAADPTGRNPRQNKASAEQAYW